MKERMQGSNQPLPSKAWTVSLWKEAGAELSAVRCPVRRRCRIRIGHSLSTRLEEALILQAFAYRFHMAMRETCVSSRQAMLAQLAGDQRAALDRIRQDSIAEARSERDSRKSEASTERQRSLPPFRPVRRARGGRSHWRLKSP